MLALPAVLGLTRRRAKVAAYQSEIEIMENRTVMQEMVPFALLRVAGELSSTRDEITAAGAFYSG